MKKKTRILMLVLMTGLSFFMVFSSAGAKEFKLLGKTGHVFGYVTQEASYGIHDDYNTQHGFNAALMNVFLEGDYQLADNLRFYGAGLLTVDWIYQLLDSDSTWEEREFDESDDLNVDDEYWQLLNEAHFTWTSAHSMLRVGKQVVSWGQIMGPAIVSQWNPMDQRRGFTSVALETTTIPIWLIRLDYFVPMHWKWLTDLNFQFIFNPNADFIPNQGGNQTFSGNDKAGIWASKVLIPVPLGPVPITFRAGSPFLVDVDERDEWSEGHEFGFRVKGVTSAGQIISLLGFYGYNNAPVLQTTGMLPDMGPMGMGPFILHPAVKGYYPLQRFVAATFSSDLEFLRTSFTGGVAPSIYLEAMYNYENTWATMLPFQPMDTSDEIKAVLEISYKVKIPALNPTTYFNLDAQINYWRVLDEDVAFTPGVQQLFLGHQDHYQTLFSINTSYFHNKLTPMFTWVRDVRSQNDMFGAQLIYAPNNKWSYTLAGQFFNTRKVNEGLYVFDEKDLIYFKIAYKWG